MPDREVTIALGGGAAKGLAHIGVLKGLEEDGVAIKAVAGTSMGSGISMASMGRPAAMLPRRGSWRGGAKAGARRRRPRCLPLMGSTRPASTSAVTWACMEPRELSPR